MFSRFVFACFLLVSVVFCSKAVFAGKVELTTYYPAPYGEYSELNASKSFIPPRMDNDQRDAINTISNPPLAQGMVIFNTTTNQLEVNRSTTAVADWGSAIGSSNVAWVSISSYASNVGATAYVRTTEGPSKICTNAGYTTYAGPCRYSSLPAPAGAAEGSVWSVKEVSGEWSTGCVSSAGSYGLGYGSALTAFTTDGEILCIK